MRLGGMGASPSPEEKGSTAPLPLIGEDGKPAGAQTPAHGGVPVSAQGVEAQQPQAEGQPYRPRHLAPSPTAAPGEPAATPSAAPAASPGQAAQDLADVKAADSWLVEPSGPTPTPEGQPAPEAPQEEVPTWPSEPDSQQPEPATVAERLDANLPKVVPDRPAPDRAVAAGASVPDPSDGAEPVPDQVSSAIGAVLAAPSVHEEAPDVDGQEDEEAAGPRHRTWSDLPRLARILIPVVAIGVIGSAILLNGCFGLLNGRVVPTVTGLSADEASTTLEAEGFDVQVQTQETQNAEDIGRVIATDPVAGTGTSSLGTSTVVVKVGKALEGTQEVPQLVGLSEDDALATIANTHFFVKDDVMRAYSDTVPAGTVISQGPPAGTAKTMGTKIDLVISDGPTPAGGGTSENTQTSVTIPDVVGMPLEDAINLLDGMGLEVLEGDDQPTDDYAKGSVASVEPGVDEAVSVGSTVTLHMAVPSDTRNDGGEG